MEDSEFDALSRRLGLRESEANPAGSGGPQPVENGDGRRTMLASLGATALALLAGWGFGELPAAANDRRKKKKPKQQRNEAKAAKKS